MIRLLSAFGEVCEWLLAPYKCRHKSRVRILRARTATSHRSQQRLLGLAQDITGQAAAYIAPIGCIWQCFKRSGCEEAEGWTVPEHRRA